MKVLFALALFGFSANAFYLNKNSPSSRILNGQKASRRQFTHMVSLQTFQLHDCGGAVVSPTWVVTSAHCFTHVENLEAVAGVLVIGEEHPDNQRIPAVELINHPGYNKNVDDIALIRLAYGFVFNDAVQPVVLPAPHENVEGRITLSGWGRISVEPSIYPDDLYFLEMAQISLDECNQRLESIGTYPWKVIEVHTCALPDKVGQSACHADSGSPLVKKGPNGNIFVGVMLGGDPRCGSELDVQSPNVLTKVSYYIDFISSHVGDLP